MSQSILIVFAVLVGIGSLFVGLILALSRTPSRPHKITSDASGDVSPALWVATGVWMGGDSGSHCSSDGGGGGGGGDGGGC